MRNLYRCRRGSVAFATVVALVPLIGVVALGAEAGSWYVTKQHAQNAADSAAMSGALAIVNSDTQPDFGTKNGFPAKVAITLGTYSTGSGFSAGGSSPNAVQAVVTQCQPQALSSVLYATSCNGTNRNVTIKAEAVASVVTPAKLPCALALNGPITFQDAAVQVNAPNCGLASNGTPIGISFQNNATVNVGSLSTAGGCSGSQCISHVPPVITYAPPITNPFAVLNTAMNGPPALTLPACSGGLKPYTASTACANKIASSQKSNPNPITVSGVYFFSDLSLSGSGSLFTCTVGAPGCSGVVANVSATIILLPGASLNMTGSSSINITAPTTVPSVSSLPAALQSTTIRNVLVDMAIFDPETSPKIAGTSTMAGSGVFYLPFANPLNFRGTSNSTGATCTEVIAAAINFAGTPSLDNSGCPDSIKPQSKFVALVQ